MSGARADEALPGDARPLIVCGPDGRPLEVLEENEKGYKKSLEHGRLWALHPGTGRLLPFHDESPVTVAEHDGWYEARLAQAPEGPAAPGGSGAPAAAARPATASDRPDLGDVLRELAAVIAARHRELPDGSYTTHLFTSGGEKIRKKAGEEAVELLLASSREALVSESADFLYHLLVLLEHEGISLDELAAELSRR